MNFPLHSKSRMLSNEIRCHRTAVRVPVSDESDCISVFSRREDVLKFLIRENAMSDVGSCPDNDND